MTLSRREVVRRYARLDKKGRAIRCAPSPHDEDRRSENKIIYDGVDNARNAAGALQLLDPLDRPLAWYVCHRSTRRHHLHLTTKKENR